MSRIPNEVIDEIRSKVNIVDVIGQYVELTKRGQSYQASCPFHEDRNPSFSIHPGKQIFKCFSCDRGGNVFGFIQEIENVNFVEAVKKVAEIANVQIDERFTQPSSQAQYTPLQEKLYQIHEKAREFYHYYLMSTQNGQPAYEYLINRQLSKETLSLFSLGLAPEKSELLLAFLGDEFEQEELIASGIFYLNEHSQQLVDRFNGRIIFPLRDRNGRTLAFSARQYIQTDRRQGKYVNSPETEIFRKSNLIYNIDLARPHIQKTRQVLVCEGFMDVIALSQAGFNYSVATMGTSMTQEQLSFLSKMAQEIIFVFDGDEAGQKATARAMDMAKEFKNVQAKSITIPQGKDPDDWLQTKGSDGFQQLINTAQSAFVFQRNYLRKKFNFDNKQELAAYIEAVVKMIAAINSPIERQLYISELAQEFNLQEEVIQEQLARIQSGFHRTKDRSRTRTSRQAAESDAFESGSLTSHPAGNRLELLEVKSSKAFNSEKLFLAQLIYHSSAWSFIDQLTELPILYHDFAQQALIELVTYYYAGNRLPLSGIIDKIENTNLKYFIEQIMWEYVDLGYSEQIMIDCLKVVNEAFIELEIKELSQKCQTLMAHQEQEEAERLIHKILSLQRQLKIQS